MEFIRGLTSLNGLKHQGGRGSVVTIGNFDGVHKGHQAVIAQLLARAKQKDLISTVIVFEPQPLEFLRSGGEPIRLMSLRDKVNALSAQHVDQLLCIKFDKAFSQICPRDFIHTVLCRGLSAQHVVVGDDFQFGRNREGRYETLVREGASLGFSVEQSATFEHDGERVSSTRIRRALLDGQMAEATTLLGRPYAVSGRVVHGEKLARRLGRPTANIPLGRKRLPLRGVYTVTVSVDDASQSQNLYCGVANVGVRPTVNEQTGHVEKEARLEVHLLDYQGDLYRRRLRVELLHKLRDEKKFESLDQLQAAIEDDVQQAKVWFQ